ncbi:MAG: PEP/pyruvate-binding domain-containing protein [Candidatus Moranbacteria bacterium]|nr:PEP/pyruvate-binding domain-containing protein [Candidatus Moranbacteria bacterium]
MKKIHNIDLSEISLYGGKGASLGELTKVSGVKVPAGFVLSTAINKDNLHQHQEQILRMLAELNVEYVAVRSSATKEDSQAHSFAGQFDTFLNVTREKLLAYILKCYESLNSEKIINYCQSRDVDSGEIDLAIVVQSMINGEVSGIAFSANPVTKNRQEIVIEAGLGLGEYIVSGVITPDKYVFCRKSKSLKIMDINYQEHMLMCVDGKNIHTEVSLEKRNKRKLTDDEIDMLVEIILNIEKHYKKPMDIEWVIKNKNIYITQARPITTL